MKVYARRFNLYLALVMIFAVRFAAARLERKRRPAVKKAAVGALRIHVTGRSKCVRQHGYDFSAALRTGFRVRRA